MKIYEVVRRENWGLREPPQFDEPVQAYLREKTAKRRLRAEYKFLGEGRVGDGRIFVRTIDVDDT